MSDTPEVSPLDQLIGSGSMANPEWSAKAEAVLAMFELPRWGEDGAAVAAAAAAGCVLIDMMAKMAVVHNLMASSTGAAIEGLVARAIETWSSLAVREAESGEAGHSAQTPTR